MSSRAASGRKRLRPPQIAAQPSLAPLLETAVDSSEAHPDELASSARPVHPPTPAPSIRSRSSSSPAPSSSSLSFLSMPARTGPLGFLVPMPARDQVAQWLPPSRRPSGYDVPGDVIPYHAPSDDSQQRAPREKILPFRATNPNRDSTPVPSYHEHFASTSSVTQQSTSGARPRALPPYPNAPAVQTGWAALSDSKTAEALSDPPNYSERARQSSTDTAYPYPYPASSSSLSLQTSEPSWSNARFAHPTEMPQPPYYSPPPHSSTLLLPSRFHQVPGALPLDPNHTPPPRMVAADYSLDPANQYPTPQSSSFSSPSTSFAVLPQSSFPQHVSQSSGAITYEARGDPAMHSRQSISSSGSSSGNSDPPAAVASSSSSRVATSAPAFVFPSSRSRMRPSTTSSPGISGFRFRGRRKSAKVAPVEIAAVPETPLPPQPVSPTAAASVRSAPTPQASGRMVSPTAASSQSAEPFYFPGARTRAHPKSSTPIRFRRRKDGNGERPGLLGIELSRKKSSVVPSLPSPESLDREVTTPIPSVRRPSLGETHGSPESMMPIMTRIGSYPLDSYDAALIEADRQTFELLRKINSTNTPSFHNYGDQPPMQVLDLGCGAGHWMLDAAAAWRSAGTQIVGFDMTDTTKALWPLAQRQGLTSNMRFVKGNFIKQALPFPDGTFQLVRMANLALCIPHERWDFVLNQVWRVLSIGGRLEFIDDQMFFPYGKPAVLDAPQLDTSIPSTAFSRLSLADVVAGGDGDSEIYNVEEEQEEETSTPTESHVDPEVWHEQAASARELESLFESMMNLKYGIHLRPNEFVFEMLVRAFGGVKEITAMHLTLAPPEQQLPTDDDPLATSPGLILWPSTFIPMPQPELESHVSKHQRVLLSCKTALTEYAAEIAEIGEGQTQSDAAQEALWDYQNFLRERFNPPPEGPSSDTSSSDANSIHDSVFSLSSVASEALDAMREYQSDLYSRYSQARSPTPTQRMSVLSSASTVMESPIMGTGGRRASRVQGRDRLGSVVSSIAPPYSRTELTHVRTFYVYEATKRSGGRFGRI
ncbi:unnamed protein product [Mycena citricolor]|uniref:Methyltransferase domain-containing protein n=1 Tax=Mycena citricolor TaxID=2018698 RepID=A0AAD2HE31_9AGAR|nr:unnamed protein product [Mycena citricolor]